jgi:hypothetical protein
VVDGDHPLIPDSYGAAILDRPLPSREELGKAALGSLEPGRELPLEDLLTLLRERGLGAPVAEGLGIALVTACAAL